MQWEARRTGCGDLSQIDVLPDDGDQGRSREGAQESYRHRSTAVISAGHHWPRNAETGMIHADACSTRRTTVTQAPAARHSPKPYQACDLCY